jgi:Rap1a immunity proteins
MKLLLLALIMISFNAYAVDYQNNGFTLLSNCKEAENIDMIVKNYPDNNAKSRINEAMECFIFLEGVRNTMEIYEDFLATKGINKKMCMSEDGISNFQASLIVANFLSKRPEILHKNRTVLAMEAFMNAFPCK